MNYRFDELARNMAKSVTRRGALKKFGLDLAGLALASLGLANTAEAGERRCRGLYERCSHDHQCCSGHCAFVDAKFGMCGG